MFIVRRSEHNPILQPIFSYSWESLATCNGCPIKENGVYHLVYRAIAEPDVMIAKDAEQSSIGHAISFDGIHYQNRTRLIYPEYEWEKYGCEDPRITKIGDTYYIFYTALSEYPFNANGIKVAVATTKDFKTIEQKHLVTPFNAKAMTLFPEKIDGKYVVVFTLHSDSPPSSIRIAKFDKLEDIWSESYWADWYDNLESQPELKLTRREEDHTEIGAPPIKTKDGWLLIYSYIKNYFSPKPIFGVEAVLLDEKDPSKVITGTDFPFLIPEEMYERYGLINNIVFPTGAILEGDTLDIYYGAADTSVCKCQIHYPDFINAIKTKKKKSLVKRFDKNPILSPTENEWEKRDVFNPAAIDIDDNVHILYRAMSEDNTSTIGYASSKDGLNIDERLEEPIYIPREDFEAKKGGPNGNSGCEDPRVTIMDDKLYMLYTAYNGIEAPRVAATHISIEDFRNKKWNWSTPTLITPQGIDDKDACLMEKKVFDHYAVMHRVNHHICLDLLKTLNLEEEKVRKCIEVFGPRPGMWDGLKVGISGPPIYTEDGWLLIYHGVSPDKHYRVGAALLDKNNPSRTISRTAESIFDPTAWYEKEGEIPNVVFPCGQVVRDDTIYLYYGGADRYVGVATLKLSWLLDILKRGKPIHVDNIVIINKNKKS